MEGDRVRPPTDLTLRRDGAFLLLTLEGPDGPEVPVVATYLRDSAGIAVYVSHAFERGLAASVTKVPIVGEVR